MTAELSWEGCKVLIFSTREAWGMARPNTLGASDVAAALGLSPWKSAYSLWAEKVGIMPPSQESRAMRRGTHMEPFIASEYARETGCSYLELPPLVTFVSARWPWLSVSPDRIVAPRGTEPAAYLELKSVTQRDGWTKGQIPEHYRVQVTAGIGVLGLQRGILCGYVAGTDELLPIGVELNHEHVEAIVEATRDFWLMVEEGRAALARGEQPTRHPDIDGSEATTQALKAQYGKEREQAEAVVLDTSEAAELEQEWAEAEAVAKAAEARVREAKNRAMAMLGDTAAAVFPGGTKVTWKTVSMPERVLAASSSRTLRRYARKGA